MDKVLFYSKDSGKEFEVELINLKTNTFVIRPDGASMVIDGADNLFDRIRAEARAELINKIQPIVERMDCTCDCESGDSDHSYEICECDKCELSSILADEPKEERERMSEEWRSE